MESSDGIVSDWVLELLARRTVVLRWAAITMFAVIGLLLAQPRTYSATASFLPRTRQSSGALAGIASQFGIAVPAGEAGTGSAFYVDLAKSREVLGRVVARRYKLPPGFRSDSGSLVDYFKIERPSRAQANFAAIKRLSASVSATSIQRTGVVNLIVQMESATVANAVANALLEEINLFNLKRRQSQAAAEMQFALDRLAVQREELRLAEDSIEGFLKRNRDYRSSPELSLQYDRRLRQLTLRQQVFVSLSQSFEQNRLEAERDTPVLTIVDAPEEPAVADPRGLRSKGIFALVFGLLVGVCIAMAQAMLNSVRSGRGRRMRELRSVLADLSHPVAFVRAVVGLGDGRPVSFPPA